MVLTQGLAPCSPGYQPGALLLELLEDKIGSGVRTVPSTTGWLLCFRTVTTVQHAPYGGTSRI